VDRTVERAPVGAAVGRLSRRLPRTSHHAPASMLAYLEGTRDAISARRL
jgi:hypothetical protein